MEVSMSASNAFTIIGVIVLLVLLAPFGTIWSLNTLFPVLNIPYTLETWLAVIMLGGGIFSIKSNN
jgi:hypothetical protein